MAILANLLRPVPAARRAYSGFSKPGGGRYFNSSKPPKVAPTANNGKVDTQSPNNDASTKDSAAQQPTSSSMIPDGPLLAITTPFMPMSTISRHPSVNPHDLKLHQFFSLHRPLLLVSQPASSIFEPSPVSSSFPPGRAQETSSIDGLDEPPEASPEDDAHTARQLARALVVNRVGASISWESSLQRLGLDVTQGRAEEVRMAEAEFEVYMDSTKRKRRSKMKKHKLKKRRRLSRAQRVKIGR